MDDTFSARKNYRFAMSLNRYEWLIRTITCHDHKIIRNDFVQDRFVQICPYEFVCDPIRKQCLKILPLHRVCCYR